MAYSFGKDLPVLGCGWSSGDSWTRIGISIGAFVVCVLSFYVTIVRVSSLTYLLLLFLLGLCGGYGWLTYSDSSAVQSSRHWCANGLHGVKFETKPAAINCHYEHFIVMCVVDAFTALAWLLLAGFTAAYKRNAEPTPGKGRRTRKTKKQRRRNNNDDDSDEDFEEESDPLLNKAGNGVGTYVYEDFVTPKNHSVNTAYGDVSYDDEDDDGGSGNVDFDSESKKRYPQLQRQQQQQQQQQFEGGEEEEEDEHQKKKKKGGAHKQEQQVHQVKRKESRNSTKYSSPNDIDFSQLAEENEAAGRRNSGRGGRVAQNGFQSAVDMQAERTPPPPPASSSSPHRQQQQQPQGQVYRKSSGAIGIQSGQRRQAQQQQQQQPQGSYKNNGDFDFESLEGNNGFGDD